MANVLPGTIANFQASLTSGISSSATSFLISTITDNDGVVIPAGTYGITFDQGTNVQEHMIITLDGSTLTATIVTRGLSVVDGKTNIPAQQFAHRRGATIKMTDHAILIRMWRALRGTDTLDNKLSYTTHPTISNPTDLADKQYVDDAVSAPNGLTAFLVTKNGANPTLTINVGAGEFIAGSTPTAFPGASAQAVTDNATNYVQITMAGSLVINTSGFVDGDLPLATVVTLSGAITTVTDKRAWLTMGLTPNQIAALVGTSGASSASNKYVSNDDTVSSDGIDQSQTTSNATVTVGEADATTKHTLVAQSFIPTHTSIKSVKLWKIADTGSFTGTVTVSLQADSSGSPSGSALATVTLSNAAWLALTAAAEFNAVFSSEYTSAVPGSTYWIVISTSTTDNSNHPNIGSASAGGYVNGSVKFKNTTDGWTAIATIDLYFKILSSRASKAVRLSSLGLLDGSVLGNGTRTLGEAIDGSATVPLAVCIKPSDGLIYKAKGNDTTLIQAYGFVNTINLISTVPAVITSGVVGGFTGLTKGQMYYVTDTAGLISATPSTTCQIPVGKAISATEILVNFGKKRFFGTSTSTGLFSETPYSKDTAVTVGFIPSRITMSFTAYGFGTTLPGTSIGVGEFQNGSTNFFSGFYTQTAVATPITTASSQMVVTLNGAATATNTLGTGGIIIKPVLSLTSFDTNGFTWRNASVIVSGSPSGGQTATTISISYIAEE